MSTKVFSLHQGPGPHPGTGSNQAVHADLPSGTQLTISMEKPEWVNQPSAPDLVGFWDGKNRIWVATKNRTKEQIQSTLSHEIGHAIRDFSQDSRKVPVKLQVSDMKELLTYFPVYTWFLVHPPGADIDLQDEAFADSYRCYKEYPDILKRVSPDLYSYFGDRRWKAPLTKRS